MEITVLNVVGFVLAFVILFFVKGYLIVKNSPNGIEEKLASAFVISSGILLIGSLILSKTIGLNWISLGVFIALAIIVSLFRSANL